MPTDIGQEVLTQEEALALTALKLGIGAFDRIYADDILMTGALGENCGKHFLMEPANRGHRSSRKYSRRKALRRLL
jgi:hypothetical protein